MPSGVPLLYSLRRSLCIDIVKLLALRLRSKPGPASALRNATEAVTSLGLFMSIGNSLSGFSNAVDCRLSGGRFEMPSRVSCWQLPKKFICPRPEVRCCGSARFCTFDVSFEDHQLAGGRLKHRRSKRIVFSVMMTWYLRL